MEPGNLATPGAPLLTIERDGVYRLEASVDESQAGRPYAWARRWRSRSKRSTAHLNARVSEIVPAVDAASRTYIVKIDLPALPQLRSGMFGRAIFPLGAQKVLAVPPAAADRSAANCNRCSWWKTAWRAPGWSPRDGAPATRWKCSPA